VELDLYGLAVCAIMSSGELDAEGLTTLAMAGGSGGSGSAGGSGNAGGAVNQVSSLFFVCLFFYAAMCCNLVRKALHVVYEFV